MIDPNLTRDIAAYGKSMGSSVGTVLDVIPDAPLWTDRLRAFYLECGRAPQRAFQNRALKSAVLDLVTFDTACHAYSLPDGGLHATDRGGALTAKKALAELLILISRHDAALARRLAVEARLRSDEHSKHLQELIATRV